jgi:hypothetical protein
MILTRDAQLAGRMRALRNQGPLPFDDWLQHAEIGYNYRLSELACALGIVQLQPSSRDTRPQRAGVARRYDDLLAGIAEIDPTIASHHPTRSWSPIRYAAAQPCIGHDLADRIKTACPGMMIRRAARRKPDLVPLIEAFRAQLLACLEECAQGRRGLFTDREHIDRRSRSSRPMARSRTPARLSLRPAIHPRSERSIRPAMRPVPRPLLHPRRKRPRRTETRPSLPRGNQRGA